MLICQFISLLLKQSGIADFQGMCSYYIKDFESKFMQTINFLLLAYDVSRTYGIG